MSRQRPLWAPWRIKYLRQAPPPGCFLCNKAGTPETDLDAHVVYRGRLAYVLLNEYPYNSGHLLVAPYRHIGDPDALSEDEELELLQLLRRGRRALAAALSPEAYNVGCNVGRAAGAAVVDHFHWHVVPRWQGDTNFMPVIGDTDCIPQALRDTAALLRTHWPVE